MRDYRFTFSDSKHIQVDFLDSEDTLFIAGELMNNNRTFLASKNAVRNCPSLNKSDQDALMTSLCNRTRKDPIQIKFDY